MGLSEADTRAKLIDPALHARGWGEDLIRRELQITNGRLFLVGSETHQRVPTFADYVLGSPSQPIAALEAKDEDHSAGSGLQQAKAYAEKLDLPYAYSSNGKAFVEFDYLTNLETTIGLTDFPTPNQLRQRVESGSTFGSPGSPLALPYNTVKGLYPRYYQDVAVRRILAAIERGSGRALLTLATGTGKTYIAAQIAWKLYATKRIRRILFLADRVFLRDQAFNEFSFFAGSAGDPRYAIDGELSPHSDLYFGIYQSLYADRGGHRLYTELPPDFFDLVVIDECHRSGFGTWREILDYFGSAVHLGLTATPKRSDNIDTYAYFGDPVYSYSLGQGIDDGFLATYKVHRVRTNLDDLGGVNVSDAVIAGAELFVPEGVDDLRDFYAVTQFEQQIVLPDWTDRICDHLAATLAASNPLEKTIVFCVNMDHAAAVRQQMQNRFAHLGIADYAVRIVSEEAYASSTLERFRDSYGKSPVLVTTVDLLSTGVDVPSVRNIVFVKPIGSSVVFKQIVGRGTRLDPITGKTWFRIIDYTNATRLFDDWDHPIDAPAELPEKPWTGVIEVKVVDADSLEVVGEATGIVVAAPNEQITLVGDGSRLTASGLPLIPVSVQLSATGYKTRNIRLTPRVPDEAQIAVVELRAVKPVTERLILKGVSVDITNEIILTIDATGQQMTVEEYKKYAATVVAEHVHDLAALRAAWLDPQARRELLDRMGVVGVHPGLLGDLDGVPDADAYDAIAHVAFAEPLLRREQRRTRLVNQNAVWLASLTPERQEVVHELLDAYVDGGAEQLQRPVLKLDRFDRFGGPVGVMKVFGGTSAFDSVIGELTLRLYPGAMEKAA